MIDYQARNANFLSWLFELKNTTHTPLKQLQMYKQFDPELLPLRFPAIAQHFYGLPERTKTRYCTIALLYARYPDNGSESLAVNLGKLKNEYHGLEKQLHQVLAIDEAGLYPYLHSFVQVCRQRTLAIHWAELLHDLGLWDYAPSIRSQWATRFYTPNQQSDQQSEKEKQ